jgi:hypothetical protein
MNKRLLIILAVFSIAMAYLETAVVVYLRYLYYPEGFTFPIKLLPNKPALIELGREAATIVMLLTIALAAGKGLWRRLAYFMFIFGFWDIFYYVWLKVLLNWPESLLTWDLLFLIPLPWSSPVLAPVLVSLAMIISAFIILKLDNKGFKIGFSKLDWFLEIIAALIIIFSFLLNAKNIITLQAPQTYRWEIFFIGLGLGIAIFIRGWLKKKRK